MELCDFMMIRRRNHNESSHHATSTIFDTEERLSKLNQLGDPFKVINEVVDCGVFQQS